MKEMKEDISIVKLNISVHFIQLTFTVSRQLVMESFYCIFCAKEVTSRQEALLCDGCDRW